MKSSTLVKDNKIFKMKYIILIIFLTTNYTFLFANNKDCYLVVNTPQNIEQEILRNISITLISKYFKPVKKLPNSGANENDCVYEVNSLISNNSTIVTLIGDGLNSFGDSKLKGYDGIKQSLLIALYSSLTEKRITICQEYDEFIEQCKKSNKLSEIKKNKLYRKTPRSEWVKSGKKWYKKGNYKKYVVFTGMVRNGIPNGFGQESYINGYSYEGNFVNGYPHGNGTKIFSDGRRYEGNFEKGKLDGKGKMIYTPKSFYLGEFKSNSIHGIGVFMYEDGKKYQGNWFKGKRSGPGKLYYPNGSFYEGSFKSDKIHGEGLFKTSKGLLLSGEFKKGKPWDVKISFKNIKFDLTIKSGKVMLER